MRKSKRILCLLLCFAILFGLSAGAAEVKNNTYIQEYELGLMKKIGIISDGDASSLSETLSRAEAVRYIIKMLGYSHLAEEYNDKSPFFDVEKGDEYYGYIGLAARIGICDGYTDGFFGVYDDVTVNAAEKFLVCGLGFPANAADTAAFPSDFSSLARRIGIYDGITAYGELNKGMFFKMMYNALHCETFSEPFAANSGYITSGDTLLYQAYDIISAEGLVTETELYSYNGVVSEDNHISIEDKSYAVNEDYNNLIGQRVKYYYTEETSDSEVAIVYAYPINKQNTLYTYLRDDIEAYKQSERILVCFEEGKDKAEERRLDSDVVVLVNGIPSTELSEKVLLPDDGRITLIDNDKDRMAECVLVESFKTIMVSAIDTERTRISDVNSSDSIDLSNEDKRVCVLDAYNREVGVDSLVANDVLLVADSTERTVIYVSKNTAAAEISEQHKKNGKYIYTVNDNEYKTSPYFDKYCTDEVGVGKDYVIYLDALGRIAFAEIDVAKMNNVAFMIGAVVVDDVFEDRITLKLLLADGTVKQVKLSEKCTIDDVRYDDCDKARAALSVREYDENGTEIYNGFRKTLITYVENDAGELAKINTAYKMDSDGILKKPFVINNGSIEEAVTRQDGLYLSYEDAATKQYLGIRSFSGYGVLSSSVKIFLVPVDENGNVDVGADDKNFTVAGLSYLTNYSTYTQEQFKYSKSSGSGDIMVIYYNPVGSKSKPDSQITLVTEVGEGLNGDGEQVKMITGYNSGKEELYMLESAATADMVSVGDAIRLYFNTRGEVSFAEMLYDNETAVFYGSRSNYGVAYGTVFKPLYDLKNNVITLADSKDMIADIKNSESLEKYVLEGTINMYRYDSEHKKVEVISAAELSGYSINPQDYDNLLLLTRGARLYTIIAY